MPCAPCSNRCAIRVRIRQSPGPAAFSHLHAMLGAVSACVFLHELLVVLLPCTPLFLALLSKRRVFHSLGKIRALLHTPAGIAVSGQALLLVLVGREVPSWQLPATCRTPLNTQVEGELVIIGAGTVTLSHVELLNSSAIPRGSWRCRRGLLIANWFFRGSRGRRRVRRCHQTSGGRRGRGRLCRGRRDLLCQRQRGVCK